MNAEKKALQRSCDNIADDEQDIRKVTTSEAFDSLDAVKCCDEIQGDMQINVMLNELVGKMEHSGYETVNKVMSICF